MTRLVFTPAHEWTAHVGKKDVRTFAGGEKHEIENASKELVKLAGSAHAAGVIEVHHGLSLTHVQSQKDGEAALRKAMGAKDEEGRHIGPWQEGNLLQAAIDEGVAKLRKRGK